MLYCEARGAKVPSLGYGTWQLKGADCVTSVQTALDIGFRHIDTAQAYGNEAEVGQAIRESAVPRDRIWLTTKVWMDNMAHGDFAASVDASLERLGLDEVDLLLLHWPEPSVPLDTLVDDLIAAQTSGKARFVGLSNYTVPLMQTVLGEMKAPVITNQVEYHPFLSQKPVLGFLHAHDMFLTAYAPLASGRVFKDAKLAEIAEAHGVSSAQVALRWLIQQDNVAAIPKAASRSHAEANFAALEFELTPAEMAAIHELTTGPHAKRGFDPAWAPDWDN